MADYFLQQFLRLGRAKLVLFSMGVLSAFVLFKVAIIPCARSIIICLVSSLPSLWISIRAWLSPPYIYIVLNLIILAVVAQNHLPLIIPTTKDKPTQKPTQSQPQENEETLAFYTDKWAVVPWPETRLAGEDFCPTESEEKSDDEKSNDDETGRSIEPMLDTLEEAWKMIMEARGKAQVHNRGAPPTGEDDPRREVGVSETLNGVESLSRDEKSMNEDELNQRVEEFIRKLKQ